jgi:hypothetical protein
MAKRGLWRQTSHGFYVQWWVDSDVVEQRIVEASMVTPAYGGAVTGWAALCWEGGRWFGGVGRDGTRLPVTVTGVGVRPQRGVRISAERLNAHEIVAYDGLLITRSLRSTLFEMRYASHLWEAVRIASMSAFSDLVSVDELWAYALAHPGMTGIPQARDATALADENCWSPMEVTMLLVWGLVAQLPRPLMNQPVFDLAGRHVGTPDLLDVESGTYGEYDGAFHLDGRRRRRDQEREDAFRSVGLEPFVMLAGQSDDEVAARMVAARERALRLGNTPRWTIEQPSWWIPTQTVAQRRALSERDRLRLLAHRAA